jgi:hypothetical protein
MFGVKLIAPVFGFRTIGFTVVNGVTPLYPGKYSTVSFKD